MKRTESMEKTDIACDPCESKYPYGLCINLGNDELKKLGINELPEIGTVMKIEGMVSVSSTHQSESLEGRSHKSLGLQITDMSLSSEKEKKSREEKIYGDKS